MESPDINVWIDQVKARPGAEAVGMMLAHRGVVRGHSRSGESVSAMMLGVDRPRLDEVLTEAETATLLRRPAALAHDLTSRCFMHIV
ncbi:MAG: hypothetical protein ACYC5Q_11395 [Thermoleophilia bacterium]